jgi:hypothetical protein
MRNSSTEFSSVSVLHPEADSKSFPNDKLLGDIVSYNKSLPELPIETTPLDTTVANFDNINYSNQSPVSIDSSVSPSSISNNSPVSQTKSRS